jgi:hypothetical protein
MDETTSGGPVSAGAEAAAGAPEAARYEQDLSRSIGILGNVFITPVEPENDDEEMTW